MLARRNIITFSGHIILKVILLKIKFENVKILEFSKNVISHSFMVYDDSDDRYIGSSGK